MNGLKFLRVCALLITLWLPASQAMLDEVSHEVSTDTMSATVEHVRVDTPSVEAAAALPASSLRQLVCPPEGAWLSIRGVNHDPACLFHWMGSEGGDGQCVAMDSLTHLVYPLPFDLSMCVVTGGALDPIGACCLPDESCIEEVPMSICRGELLGEFMGEGVLCSATSCAAPEPLHLYADPQECSDFRLPSTGVGLGRSPTVDHVGRVGDTPVSGVTEVPDGLRSVPVGVRGERTVAGRRDSEPPRSEPGPPQPPRTRRNPPSEPNRRECVPPTPPGLKKITSSPIYRMLRRLAGGKAADPINALDLGMGVGWNPSTAVMLHDAARNRFVLVGRDSGITTFHTDGLGNWFPSAGGFYELNVSLPTITATYKNGTTYTFTYMEPAILLPGIPFLLQTVADRNGNTSTYEYDQGRLIRMTDPAGREVNLTHHPDGHIQTITDELGRQQTFEYVGDNLSAIVLPNGDRIEYTYDADHMMTSKAVPGGGVYELQYHPGGITLLDPNAAVVVDVNGVSQVD